jgi:hypothetical protein
LRGARGRPACRLGAATGTSPDTEALAPQCREPRVAGCELRGSLQLTVGARVLPVWRLVANGLDAWPQVLERGYEGYVAKEDANVRRRPDEGGAQGEDGCGRMSLGLVER